jgi:putative cell wall-binding protein
VRVSGVVDSTRPVKSALPIDPIVELYSTGGGLLARVDNVWESGTELAAVNVGAPSRILIRVSNFYPNGNRAAYGITPTFVDNVAPTLAARSPAPGAVRVSYDGAVISATFSEPVSGVSGSTFQLKTAAGALVPASVGYAAASRRATLRPSAPLAPEAVYQVLINAGIKDALGLGLAPTSWTFTSGKAFPRIAGPDRYATSAALSAATFSPGVAVAYIANGQTFPDALAGGPAARVGNGPLLLSASGELPAPIVGELSRLRPGRIVILGGTGGISGSVQSQLAAFTTGSVTRVAGVDRYATAAAVSRSVWTQGAPTVYVATGEGYADALSASAVASRNRHPILLVRQGAIPAATLTELNRLGPDRIVVMGGSAVISDAVLAQLRTRAPSVTRIAGADRYETSVKLSAATFAANGVTTAYVASGTSFPDGLSVGPIAGRANAPLLLVPPTGLPGVVANELRRLDPTSVVFVGGTTMVSDTVRNQVRAIWP